VFYFRDVRTPELKQKQKFFVSADHRQHCLTAVLFQIDVRTSLKQNTETVLGLFQPHYSRVEKYANEAETVSVFYLVYVVLFHHV